MHICRNVVRPDLWYRKCGHHLAETDELWLVQSEHQISHYGAALQSQQIVVVIHAMIVVDDQTSNYIILPTVNNMVDKINIPMAWTIHWLQCKHFFFYFKLEHVLLKSYTLIQSILFYHSQNSAASGQMLSIICYCKCWVIRPLESHAFDIQTRTMMKH